VCCGVFHQIGLYCFGVLVLPLVDMLESLLFLSDDPGMVEDELDEPEEFDIPLEPDDAPFVDSLDFMFLAAGLVPESTLLDGLPPCDCASTASAATAAPANMVRAAAAAIRVFICCLLGVAQGQRTGSQPVPTSWMAVDKLFVLRAMAALKKKFRSAQPQGG
jgi:hypothetical protein